MHIENLRFFYEVAKAKSISTVAKSSHISQSALSQQLLKLEDSLNTKLFIRSNKGVTLTTEGEIVYKHCKVILNTYEKMLYEVESSNSKESHINIDGINILTSTLIPSAISKIKKSFPNHIIKITSSEDNSNNIIHNISDINISYSNYNNINSIVSKEIYSDRIVFVAHSTFKSNSLTIKKFMNTPFIVVNDNLKFRDMLASKLENLDYDIQLLNILFTTDSYQSAIIGIKNIQAISAIPYGIYNSVYKDLGYKIVDIEGLEFP
ncbi:MAG: LysR family transcriptional regulator, partial [Clostridium paraputrificum]